MGVYIIDYASVGAKGLKEIQNTADKDAVFFIYSAQEGTNPVEIQKNNEKKELVNPVKISMDVLNKARNAFSQKAEAPKQEARKAEPKKAEPKKSEQPKKPETKKEEPKKSTPTELTDDIKRKLRAAVKPVGIKTAQYAMLYKAFAESADKNEYNIALQRSFKVQKRANEIYKLTRQLFEETK